MQPFRSVRAATPARCLLLLALAVSAVAQTAQFVPIPGTSTTPGSNPNFCGLSGTTGYSGVRVSPDGNVVATVVYSPGFVPDAVPRQAARWTAASGTTVIQPDLPGNYGVVGMSFDGSVIYGESWRWTAATGAIDLLPWLQNDFGQQQRIVFGCALDGVTVVGVDGPQPGFESDMVRWPLGVPGPVESLPRPSTFPEGYFYFNTVSGDGQVVGGSARRGTTSPTGSDSYAAVLVTTNGATLLTGESSSEGVTGLSIDGSVAVGYTQVGGASAPRLAAFRWDATAGVVQLDSLATFSDASYARATNFDGSTVVGDYLVFGQPGTRAFLWTEPTGFVDLREHLVESCGLEEALAGWDLLVATDVSLDGRTIVGQGVGPNGCEQAFLVRFPVVPGTAAPYGPSCNGPLGPLQLVATTTPYVGGVFRATCSGIAADTSNAVIYGLTPLAVPLTAVLPAGLPGCELLATVELFELLPPGGPTITTSIVVPADPLLVGVVVHQQVLQVEFSTTGAQLAARSSNGLVLTCGLY